MNGSLHMDGKSIFAVSRLCYKYVRLLSIMAILAVDGVFTELVLAGDVGG